MNKTFFFSLLATSMLTACGGSSSDKPESPVLEVNKAPVAVADEGLVQNNEALTLNVLANDTDSDNDSLSIGEITVQPENGTVEISNNTLVYTPEVNFAGVDTLSYRVSDGELTSDASVALTINHTMTLSGKITDSPIANALVKVEIGGEVFEVTAGAEGNYQLPIIINDMDAVLLIRATGSVDNEQDDVELVVISGGVKQLLKQVDTERTLSKFTNATHVSTATYLLVKDRNEGEGVNSAEQLEQLSSEISAEELLETASFIKLLIDNDAFAIPEGKTVITTLESITGGEEGVEVSTAEAIQGYLEDNSLVDENGEPIAEYNDAIAAAKQETLADPDVMAQFTAAMFSGKKLIELSGAKSGWHEERGVGWVFNTDKSAEKYVAIGQSVVIKDSAPNWSIKEGKLELTYVIENHKPNYPIFSYPFYQLIDDYGFDESVRQAFVTAVDNGAFYDGTQIQIKSGYTQQKITLLAQTESVYQVNVSGEYMHTLIMPEQLSWQEANPTATVQKDFNANFAHGYESLFADKTIEDIAGDWIFSIDYELKGAFNDFQLESAFMGDKITLTNSAASGMKSGLTFASSLDDEGRIILSLDDTTYKIKPIIKAGKSYLAVTEKWVAGALQYIIANSIAKFDDSHASFTDNLVTEFPEVYLAYINGSKAENWQGDKLKLDAVWGYKFNADGTLNRGVNGTYGIADAYSEYDKVDHFYLGDDRWTWDKADNIVNIRLASFYKRHRTWEVVSVDEQGRAVVFESSTFGWDVNNDGEVTDAEIGQYIMPRINIQRKDDLSRWADAWQNTVNAGLVPNESATPLKPTMNSRNNKTVVN